MQPNLEEPQQPKTGAVRSMTGYGRARQLIGNKEITVEIRSVNHRFLEYSSRVPRAYAYLEEKLKNLIKGSVSRGKVDVSLSIQTVSVHLHGSRYPCIKIAFCFSFLHTGRPFLPSLNIHPLLSSSPDLHSECSTPTNGAHIPAHGGYPVPILSQSDRESENIYKIPCGSCLYFPAILLFWFCSPFHLPHKAKIHVAYLL